jgi:hypothetical protein
MLHKYIITTISILLLLNISSLCIAQDESSENLKAFVEECIKEAGYFNPDKAIPVYSLAIPDKAAIQEDMLDFAKMIFPKFAEDTEGELKIQERGAYFLIDGPDDLRLRVFMNSGFLFFERADLIYAGGNVDITEEAAIENAKRFLDDNQLVAL